MEDPYVQEGGTLKNKLGIKEYKELKAAECDIGFIKLISLSEIKAKKCDSKLLKTIHKYIFEDIYDWAGDFRTVPIYKTEVVIPGISLDYADVSKIEPTLQQEIKQMNEESWNASNAEDFTKKLTKHLAKIWKVHPFRDGNTRATLSFGYLFAKEHGLEMDMESLINNLVRKVDSNTGKIKQMSIRDKFVLASLDDKDYPEPEHLENMIKIALKNGKQVEQGQDHQR